MLLKDINENDVKSVYFKGIIVDLIYSIRQSFKRHSKYNLDIKLHRIRFSPTYVKSNTVIIIDNNISNLIGGHIYYMINSELEPYLDSFDNFIIGLNDYLNNLTNNNLSMMIDFNNRMVVEKDDLKGSNWEDCKYYIEFYLSIIEDSQKKHTSKFIVGIDKLVSIYF